MKKNLLTRKKIFLIGWALALFFVFTNRTEASWPTENITGLTGVNLSAALNSVEQKTRSIILARMQQEAIKQIQDTMADLVVGDGYNSYIISDYEDFIYGTARRAAKQKMVDFFKKQGEGVTMEERQVLHEVEAKVREDLFGDTPKQDLGQYVEDAYGRKTSAPYGDMFKGNSLAAWVRYETGPFNKPWQMVDYTEKMLRDYMKQVEDAQRTKAIANQGFDPKNGVPGSVIAQLVAQSEGAPIEMISNATTAEQVVTSLATSTLTSFMRNGYSRVAKPAANQIDKINEKYEGGVKTIQDLIYEGQN